MTEFIYEPKLLNQNQVKLAIPGHYADQLKLYGMWDSKWMDAIYIKRPKDEIDPCHLNYPWKDHPC